MTEIARRFGSCADFETSEGIDDNEAMILVQPNNTKTGRGMKIGVQKVLGQQVEEKTDGSQDSFS